VTLAGAARVDLGHYRRVLGARQVPRLLAAMVAGRLPNGMRPLGIVFLIHEQQGSYAASGVALAALMAGTTGSAPFRGRAVDRWGQFRVLFCLSLVQAAVLSGFVACALTGQGMPVLIPLATVTGATSSTLGGSMRALWPVLVRSAEDLPAAYALQAILEDLITVTGPLVASLLLVAASPAAVLTVSGSTGLAGTIAFVITPTARSAAGRPDRSTSFLGAMSTPGMRVLAITLASSGAVIGVLNVAVPAFAQKDGAGPAAGVLLAMLSASSAVSGLCYGARSWKAGSSRRYVWLAGVFAVLVIPLAAADSLVQLGGLLVLVGLAYAPRIVSAYLLLDDLAPDNALTEAYTWLVSANAGGIALGAALAGPAVQHAGVHWALALAGGSAVIGLIVAAVRHSVLQAETTTRGTPHTSQAR
jgi:MFS family permease